MSWDSGWSDITNEANVNQRHPTKEDFNSWGSSTPDPYNSTHNNAAYNPYNKTNEYSNQYDNNYQYQGGTPHYNPLESMPSQFVSDPMVNAAAAYGQQFANDQKQKLSKLVSVNQLKYFFQVDNAYVGKKLALLLFPFAHKEWSVELSRGGGEEPVPPRQDVNAPDLYIPLMATITYVLLAGFVLGTQARFTPEQLGLMTSNALAWLLCENIIVLVTKYIMNISDALSLWHTIALSAYKYFGMIVALLLYIFLGKSAYYMGLAYCALAITFFLVRSVKAFVLNLDGGGKKRKLYLLLYISLSQPFVMWWLTSSITSFNPQGVTDPAWFMNAPNPQFGGRALNQYPNSQYQQNTHQGGNQQNQQNPPQGGNQQYQQNPPQGGNQQYQQNPPQGGNQQYQQNPPQGGNQQYQQNPPQRGNQQNPQQAGNQQYQQNTQQVGNPPYQQGGANQQYQQQQQGNPQVQQQEINPSYNQGDSAGGNQPVRLGEGPVQHQPQGDR